MSSVRSLRSGGAASGRGRARFARLVLALVALAAVPGGVRGQVADSIPLTFEEAVRVALENNPAYLRQVNAVATAEHGERQSFGQAFLPTLSASVDFGGGGSRTQVAVDELGNPIAGTGEAKRGSNASQSLAGGVTLFSLESIRSYAAARARTAAAGAGVAYQAAVLRNEVGRAYFDVVRRRELVDVERRGLETARESLAAIRALLRIAAKDPTDVLGAELSLARAEQSLNQAEGEARKARLTLKGAMGVPLDREYALATGFPDVFDPASLDAGALLARAMRDSPRLAREAADVEAAERSVSAAGAARLPSLAGSYSYTRSTTNTEGFGAIGAFDLPNQGWRFGFGVDIPLFNRMGTSAAIGRAEVEAANARESLREAELALERELRAALIDLENAYEGVRLAERSAEIARQRLAQGRERYRLGTIDYTALQDMLNSVAQEERGVTNALYTFTTALLALEEKVGGPVRD